MRFATIRTADGTTAARFDGDTLTPLDAPDVGALLAAEGGPGGVSARVGAAPVLVAEADFAPVVPSPSKVICVGLNYRTHIQETGRELPEYPTLFAKFAETLMGPYDDLALPSVSNRVDWEAELGLIIGRPVYRADAAEAAGAIAGYTVCNDVSMRDFQRRTLQWLAGKMFQHSTPAGPYLVTPDEVGNAADLEIGCEVDGQDVGPAVRAGRHRVLRQPGHYPAPRRPAADRHYRRRRRRPQAPGLPQARPGAPHLGRRARRMRQPVRRRKSRAVVVG
jgi:acylpyruvate hydrolase